MPRRPSLLSSLLIAFTTLTASTAVVVAPTTHAGIPTFALDHFNVYDASGAPALSGVQLTDQFGMITTTLGAPLLFLVPADKNSEGIQDPFGHLTCYRVVDPGPTGPQVIATNQFGAQALTLGLPQVLCAPTIKLIDDPGPSSLDHYLCYDASGATLNVGASIQDQFQSQTSLLADPFLFCNPVDKNGEGIGNAVDHLACFNYSPSGQPVPFPVPITNQFFAASTELPLAAPRALCVPSAKQVVVDSVDHFTLYAAQGPDGPQVSIADQFGAQDTDLGLLDNFMVPADKNGEGIFDPFSHLACHRITEQQPAPPQVVVDNQLGQQVLDVGDPLDFCVPTEKLITPGPISLDHFRCWQAAGPAVDAAVTWSDQFQSYSGQLDDPFLLCNPADKNGEGIANPDDHLVCYKINPLGQPISFPVPIANQFFAGAEINLLEPYGLCLPSSKRILKPIDHFSLYRAAGLDGPTVTIADQFLVQTLDLGLTDAFMVPADKNGEGILDPISHLSCHEIDDPNFTPRKVQVTNQFVSQQDMVVGAPRELCLPTEKLITPGTVDLDHYKCYDAEGPPLGVQVDWVDQFQSAGVTLEEPLFLCNPADKNGEGILNPVDHLVCYRAEPPGVQVGQQDVVNQFNQGGPIDIQEPFALCVPSQKIYPVPEPSVWLGLAGGILLLARLDRRRRARATR